MGARGQGLWEWFWEWLYETFNNVTFSCFTRRFGSVIARRLYHPIGRVFAPSDRQFFSLLLGTCGCACARCRLRCRHPTVETRACTPPVLLATVVHAAALCVTKHPMFGATLALLLPFRETFHVVLPARASGCEESDVRAHAVSFHGALG